VALKLGDETFWQRGGQCAFFDAREGLDSHKPELEHRER
jgi:hypothetical protein